MNKLLYDTIRKSNKSLDEISRYMCCSVDTLVDKILGYSSFSSEEINDLVAYIPLKKPTEIFFTHYVH